MSKMWIVFTALVLALIAGPTPSPARAQQPDDRVLGNPDAPITIYEYGSLGCIHCADFDRNTLPALKRAWIDTGKARLIFRDFPLDQPSIRAAMLARCAPPEQFYAFVDVLFQQQAAWYTAGNVETGLSKIAKLGGMSDEKFKACMADDALRDRVLASRLQGEQQYHVQSTPTFIINGTRVEGALPLPEFEKALAAAAGG